MGYKEIELNIPTAYSEELLKQAISKTLRINNFTFQVINKSLDARKKGNIKWLIRVGVSSPEIRGDKPFQDDGLNIFYKKRNKKVVVTGSGPAGFFAAYVLQKSGFEVTLIERGSEVDKRAKGIRQFEKDGVFNPLGNYAFGEGGAGTFSDGKLTSRSKRVSKEKDFILKSYIIAGGPAEIAYMAHPHLGTDNLKKIVKNLREDFLKLGGTLLFETLLTGLSVKNGKINAALTSGGELTANYFLIAPGHSAFETYRMLMNNGVPFRTKNFAIGSRAEHKQEIINRAQWGTASLPGVKAAEYRLTTPADGKHQVYTFCMCPGGIVVPATAYEHTNIVNGMSYFQRNGEFANAACVAGLHPDQLAGRTVSPLEALDELEKLEIAFFEFSQNYSAPFCTIGDFISQKITVNSVKTSYPPGLAPAPLWKMLPPMVVNAMQQGLKDFSNKLKGYEKGILLGLESKTSSPI
ncbi:MAG TPA: NAD(P)/FAD-dependent oxidoreductase, partial [Bacteroidales bacterium]